MQQRLYRASSCRRGWVPLFLCLQGYKPGRILLQHGELQVPWGEVALLSAVVGSLAVRSRRAPQVGRGDPSSHPLFMGGPVFRAQSLFLRNHWSSHPACSAWNSVGRMVELLTPRDVLSDTLSPLTGLDWEWPGVMVSLSCSLAVLGIEFRASRLLDKHFTTELHHQLPSSFLILRQSLNWFELEILHCSLYSSCATGFPCFLILKQDAFCYVFQ